MTVSATPIPRLIPAHQRLKFVAIYVFLTMVLWVLFGAFFSLSFVPNLTLRVTLNAIVTGGMVGTGQWLALRSYIPGWMWIVATAIGSGLVTLTQSLWYSALLKTIQTPDPDNFLNIFLSTPFSILLPVQVMTVLALCLWFAGAQWLVLRRYVRAAAWWVLTPALSLLLVWTILILQLVLTFSVALQQQVLLPACLAATQALMLCWFQRQQPLAEADPEGEGAMSSVGLVATTIASVLILSLSMQGFLIWLQG